MMMSTKPRENFTLCVTLYKEREERLRSAHAEHVEELEARISSLLERRRAMMESHREELEEERERRRRELAEQSEEHKDALQGWPKT